MKMLYKYCMWSGDKQITYYGFIIDEMTRVPIDWNSAENFEAYRSSKLLFK